MKLETEIATSAPSRARRYVKRCKVCQFMKKNATYRSRVYNSTYFDSNGRESVLDIVQAFPGGPSQGAVYMHLKNKHLEPSKERKVHLELQKQQEDDEKAAKALITQTTAGLAVEQATKAYQESREPHMRALDNYIRQAEEQILQGKLKITANNFLAAVKIKEDAKKNAKGAQTEALKVLAALAAPRNTQNPNT